MIARVIADSRPTGTGSPLLDSAATLILSTMAGLTIDLLERGDSPPLQQAFEDFKQHVTTLVDAMPPARSAG